MEKQIIDLNKRRFLTKTTTVVGAVGLGFVAVPFLSSWQPSAKTKAAGSPVDIDISKLEYGQAIRVLYRKKAVLVFKRNANQVANLKKTNNLLADPLSEKSQQPDYVVNNYRSIKEELAVLEGICTHLGCSPTYIPEAGIADLGGDSWLGGLYCPCHGSKFDLAGRVYAGAPAPTNLNIPKYSFVTDNLIRIGVDPRA